MSRRPKKPEQPIHMAEVPAGAWRTRDSYILLKDMTNTHLQRAKMDAQKRMEVYFHKMNKLDEIIEQLDEEGERRNLKLRDYDSNFHRKQRKHKNKYRNDVK
jgi:hypothetical protein